MKSKEVEKKKHSRTIMFFVVFLILTGFLVFLFINLFTEKITNTSNNSDTTRISSLYCSTRSINIPNAFFDISDAESAKQAIKVIFKDEKIDNISYDADISYKEKSIAKKKEAELGIKYGLYAQDNNKKSTDLSSNFSAIDNKVKITLFSTVKQLIPAFRVVFFIDDDDLEEYTIDTFSTLYGSKGFSCEIKE